MNKSLIKTASFWRTCTLLITGLLILWLGSASSVWGQNKTGPNRSLFESPQLTATTLKPLPKNDLKTTIQDYGKYSFNQKEPSVPLSSSSEKIVRWSEKQISFDSVLTPNRTGQSSENKILNQEKRPLQIARATTARGSLNRTPILFTSPPAPHKNKHSGFQPAVGRFGLAAPFAPGTESAHNRILYTPNQAVRNGGAILSPYGTQKKWSLGASLDPFGPYGIQGQRPGGGRYYGPPTSEILNETHHHTPCLTPGSLAVPYSSEDFSPDPYMPIPYDGNLAVDVYSSKKGFPDAPHPLIEWGMDFYGAGPIPQSRTLFGSSNLVQPKFYLYGDYRLATAYLKNNGTDKVVLAQRLNLDMDFFITSTERIHMFISPFQQGTDYMRVEVNDGKATYFEELDGFDENTDNLFFEGDLGYILGGFMGIDAPFDLPIAVGLVPLLFQNGIWIEDAFVGGAMTIPARNNPWLDWSNYDITLFAGLDQITSRAFNDNRGGKMIGATTMIESRGGYFEAGYAFLEDRDVAGRSYHNFSASYTRRYMNFVSNSMRVIVNTGQNGPASNRTADGYLLLMENAFLTPTPYNTIPYANFFLGVGSPQSAARAAGPLKNTGINFETDGVTGYPLLDDSAKNTFGGAFGVDFLASDLSKQLILEFAFVQTIRDNQPHIAKGNQYALGLKYQMPISNRHIFRADTMYGWREGEEDIVGIRFEFRQKF